MSNPKREDSAAANITDVSIIVYHTGYSHYITRKIQRNLKILENEIKTIELLTDLLLYEFIPLHS